VKLSKASSVCTFLCILPGQLRQYKSLEKNLTTTELCVLIAEGEQAHGGFSRNSCGCFQFIAYLFPKQLPENRPAFLDNPAFPKLFCPEGSSPPRLAEVSLLSAAAIPPWIPGSGMLCPAFTFLAPLQGEWPQSGMHWNNCIQGMRDSMYLCQ